VNSEEAIQTINENHHPQVSKEYFDGQPLMALASGHQKSNPWPVPGTYLIAKENV
jgi:hypothetical protein